VCKEWQIPDDTEQTESEPAEMAAAPPPLPSASPPAKTISAPKDPSSVPRATPAPKSGHPIEIESVEGGLSELLKKLEGQ